tara:strand:- start:1006 stop:1137 length:132 start_codon:yes stop_codon:yes gene_type:complete
MEVPPQKYQKYIGRDGILKMDVSRYPANSPRTNFFIIYSNFMN